ncbi:MAG: glycine cleavage system aminomethyltransferase GcvT [Planctomycetota bacterium]
MVEDARWTSFTLAGPKSPAVLEKAALEEGKGFAVDPGDGRIEIFVPEAGALDAWKRFAEAGAEPSGAATRQTLRDEKGYPGAGAEERPDLAPVLDRLPSRGIRLTKPFFVGMTKGGNVQGLEGLPSFSHEPEELPLRRTPLFEEHVRLTKKRNIVPFAGWEMPVVYTSITEEHHAVRNAAGLFDVGHMGVFEVSGPHAARFLDLVTTNYVPKLGEGESMYAYLLDPEGNCIDDLMIYRVEAERFMVVVNAVNAEKDFAWLNAYNSGSFLIDPDRPWARVEAPAVIRDLKDPAAGADGRIDMAVQGPRSIDILIALAGDDATRNGLRSLRRNMNARLTLASIDLVVSRTGYTGEEWGYELYVHPEEAPKLWNRLLEAGRPLGLQPTGLGARDSTRTEAGLPLYGHELAGPLDIDPVEAGYEVFVKWHKPFFVGRKGLLERMRARKRQIIRFRAKGVGARLAHLGDPIVSRNGKAIGHVTSSALTGEDQIGMALVEKNAAVEGALLAVCLPPSRKAPAEGPKSELKPGERVLLPLEGEILSRFPASD